MIQEGKLGRPTASEGKMDPQIAEGGRGRENGEREVLLVKGRPELDGVRGEASMVGARVDEKETADLPTLRETEKNEERCLRGGPGGQFPVGRD